MVYKANDTDPLLALPCIPCMLLYLADYDVIMQLQYQSVCDQVQTLPRVNTHVGN